MFNKRFFSIFIVFCTFFSSFSCAKVSSEEYSLSLVNGEYELLEILEIIDESKNGEFTEDKVVTRGEFAEYLARIAGVSGLSENAYSGKFADLSAKNPYLLSIQALENMGVINGNGSGNFFPDEPVLVRDAVVMAVRLLGYDIYAFCSCQ